MRTKKTIIPVSKAFQMLENNQCSGFTAKVAKSTMVFSRVDGNLTCIAKANPGPGFYTEDYSNRKDFLSQCSDVVPVRIKMMDSVTDDTADTPNTMADNTASANNADLNG